MLSVLFGSSPETIWALVGIGVAAPWLVSTSWSYRIAVLCVVVIANVVIGRGGP